MFSGKKFRLWSRQPPAAKKDSDREQQTRAKNRSGGQQTKADGDNITTIPSTVSPFQHDNAQAPVIQKLRDDNFRLEEIIKDLTPYKIQALALEKKLIATTKACEKREIKYTASISSLECENEQLREEIKRCRYVCSGCYFCARPQQQQQFLQYSQEPLSAKLFASPPPPPPSSSKDFPCRNDDGSIDSMQSGESWRRLERLEETQSAIFKETSRQKQETSRCLQQITNELVKALASQKSLRQDCTQMQDRICHLEKQNERLNKVIFRQYTPSSSTSSSLQTRHPTVRRNEQPVVVARSGQAIFLNDIPSQKISSTDVNAAKENNFALAQEDLSPYATPHRNRFSHETHGGATENCELSDNHIPEAIVRDDTMPKAIDNNTTHGVGDSAPSKCLDSIRNASHASEPGTGRNLGWNHHHHRENDNGDACDWDASTSSVSVSTLQDETEGRRCNDTRQNRGSNYSLNDILDGDIDELRLSIQNLESTRQEKRRSSRNLQCSVNDVFEELVRMPSQTQGGHNSSVEKGKRYSYPGSSLVKSGSTPEEKQLMLRAPVDVEGAAKTAQNCENTAVSLLSDKQKQLETALQKIENVINNGSTSAIGTNNDALSDVERENLHEDHTVTDTNTEDVTSDEDLAWNLVGKDRRFGDLRQEEEEEEERGLLQSDSQTDVSESDQNDEISALVGDDNTSEEGRFVSELNKLKPQTPQHERERTPVSQSFQTECLHPNNSSNEEEKQCIKMTDCQATMEAKLFSKNNRKLDRSDSGNMTITSEDRISIRRHSLTNDNRSNKTKKEIVMSKDMVTALTAYFEEVHAEHCSGIIQHSTPKSRSLSFASRSSSDSKGNSSFDDNDTSNTCSGIHDHTDEFRTIRHQRSAAKTAEGTDAYKEEQIHDSGSEKPLMETQVPETRRSESELVTGGRCVQPSQNTELDHHPVDSTPEFTPVDLQTSIAVSQGKSQHNETSSLQEHFEQAPQGSCALQNLQEDEGKMPLACTNEIINMSTMVANCEFDDQTHCQSLSSTNESASPLHVNYIRTCSLKSFWDVVTPPSSPRVDRLDEGKIFPDVTTQHDDPNDCNAMADKTDIVQIHDSSDSKDDCIPPKSHGEEPLEREITPVATEDEEDHSQNYSLLPLLGQSSSGLTDINKDCGDFEDDQWYGIPLKEHVLFKCEFPESHQEPEALRHEFAETSSNGKTYNSGDNKGEHLLDCIQSNVAEPSGIDEEQGETSSGGTLTEKDIRKYRLGCHDYSGHQQGCHDDNIGNDAAGEDHLCLPVEQITEMECSENQRGLSSKPPLPPKRFHSMQYYARDNSNLDQEIPDYEELREDNDDFSYNGDKKRYHGTESSPYDNRKNLTLESEKYVFRYPKSEAHIPGLPSAATGFQLQKNPVQFRAYSKSWDSEKRNSYPAARFRSYSQPEEQWDNVAPTDLAWRCPVDFERNVRPLSAYQVLNTSSRGLSTDVPSQASLAVRQPREHKEKNQKSKDADNDLVFHEITKQIESLQQTVNELQNREANSYSIF